MSTPTAGKKRRQSLARQLKVKSVQEHEEDHDACGLEVIKRASNIKRVTADHRRAVVSSSQACEAAKRDIDAITDSGRDQEINEKIAQLSHLYKTLAEKFEALVKYSVELEASVELAVSSRYQHAMTVAMGDTESASDGRDPSYAAALISSVHRR